MKLPFPLMTRGNSSFGPLEEEKEEDKFAADEQSTDSDHDTGEYRCKMVKASRGIIKKKVAF